MAAIVKRQRELLSHLSLPSLSLALSYNRRHVFPVELGLREGADVVSHLLARGDGQLHQPLDDRIDVDEVQTLDLVGLQAMGTLHARQHSNNLLR